MPENINIKLLIKRILSLLSIGYVGLMAFLAFASLYYDVKIVSRTSFIILEIFLGLLFGGTMIYTRKQILTSIAGLFGLLFYLPVVVLYYSPENLILLIPLGIISVLVFFFSGAGEGIKTILGTIYLLLYIICILAYYLYVSIFAGNTIDTVTYESISPSQAYRCYVLDITDSSEGTTKVIIEPNTLDIDYGSIKFVEKGYKRIVYNVRKNKLNIIPEWTTDPEDGDILMIDGEVRSGLPMQLMKIRHTGILLQKTENTDSYVKFKALSSSELNAFSRKDSLYDKKNNTFHSSCSMHDYDISFFITECRNIRESK